MRGKHNKKLKEKKKTNVNNKITPRVCRKQVQCHFKKFKEM